MIRDAILLPFERTRAAKVMTGAITHILRREPLTTLGEARTSAARQGTSPGRIPHRYARWPHLRGWSCED